MAVGSCPASVLVLVGDNIPGSGVRDLRARGIDVSTEIGFQYGFIALDLEIEKLESFRFQILSSNSCIRPIQRACRRKSRTKTLFIARIGIERAKNPTRISRFPNPKLYILELILVDFQILSYATFMSSTTYTDSNRTLNWRRHQGR